MDVELLEKGGEEVLHAHGRRLVHARGAVRLVHGPRQLEVGVRRGVAGGVDVPPRVQPRRQLAPQRGAALQRRAAPVALCLTRRCTTARARAP